MPKWPAWNDQTTEQKLDFLHEWLVNTEETIKQIGGTTLNLRDRLRKVEEEIARRPSAENPDRS